MDVVFVIILSILILIHIVKINILFMFKIPGCSVKSVNFDLYSCYLYGNSYIVCWDQFKTLLLNHVYYIMYLL